MDLTFPLSNRDIFVRPPSLLSICSFCRQFEAPYVVSIADTPVLSVSDIDAILERPYQPPQPQFLSEFLLPTPLPSALLLSVAGEGMTRDAFCHAVHEHATLPS